MEDYMPRVIETNITEEDIRIDLIGGWVENGEYPYDKKALTKMIKGISYNNAVNYFGFKLEEK